MNTMTRAIKTSEEISSTFGDHFACHMAGEMIANSADALEAEILLDTIMYCGNRNPVVMFDASHTGIWYGPV